MSFFIGRGPLVLLSFVVQCSLWFYCTAMAFGSIKAGKITQHQDWMIRSYSLTLAAVTLRIYIFVASFFVSLNDPMAYATLAWLSWVPNFVIAGLLIKRKTIPSLKFD